ncbi:MAG TPA: aryl-sulfate sulfotransferase [Vicinamibacterales bacterium]
MKRLCSTLGLLALVPTAFGAYPSVYPTGTTIYQPEKTWNGYTLHDAPDGKGVALIDMNGRVLKRWEALATSSGVFRMLPGGYVMGGDKDRPPHQEAEALIQLDWNGKEVWRFDRTERVKMPDGDVKWVARLHHDWQREGSPAGYFSPLSSPLVSSGRTLILAHANPTRPEITDRRLEDDLILEVSWSGEILWKWSASDHVNELGFSEEARNTLNRSVTWNPRRESADWLHLNAAAYVGPNRWYDAGDKRFHPANVLWSSREANIVAIVDRSGAVVWRMGPDYRESDALRSLGQIIGQHNPHIIPRGLPGEGNLLVFDNGGAAGYGAANPAAPSGIGSVRRASSRVLEINPVTFEKIWDYSLGGAESYRFFSHYVSNAQRLPNGNTLINEGADGRIFEVTPNREIVWEYINPFSSAATPPTNRVYRAYRIPYDWVPQLARPQERAVVPPDRAEFRIEPR